MDKKPETIDEIFEFLGNDTIEILRDLIKPEKFPRFLPEWLDTPLSYYDNKTPYEIFKEDGKDKQKLKDHLYGLLTGDYCV